MTSYVADTHALFWYLSASPRLGTNAKQAFQEGTDGRAIIFVPAIVMAELFFLNEKAGRPLEFGTEYQRLASSGQFVFVDFHAEEVLDFDHDVMVSEMHDRMIVGVARRLNATCLTIDSVILGAGLVPTLW